MGFVITTLMENHSPKTCYMAEHGLSLLVEGCGFRLLYDTGSSPGFLNNARTMGIDLTELDALVLSHSHYDHTGGITALLAERTVPVYLGTGFFEERYSRKTDGLRDIGTSVTPSFFSSRHIPVTEVSAGPLEFFPGVYVLSGFRTQFPEEAPPKSVLRGPRAALRQDTFEDEVVIVLRTEKELCLLSGCSHNGLLSMCARVEELFGHPVTTFLGGTHLMEADGQRIEYTCSRIKNSGIRRLGACHCNGAQATEYFQKNLPGFFENHVGTIVTVD